VCQAVTTDRSAQAIAELPDYAYLKPLLALNRYLGAIRYDWNRRHWVARALDPGTGEAVISPQGFSWRECRDLLRMLLTIDVAELERARRASAELAAGGPVTSRARRLARPQFRNISFEELLAIDFMSSVDGHGPEHWALVVWDDVVNRGKRFPVPDITPVPRTPLPTARRIPVDVALQYSPCAGLSDPVAEAFGAPPAFVPGGRAGIRLNPLFEGKRAFEVDPEAAGLFEAFEFDGVVARARTATLPAGSAARYYLQLGTIQVPKGRGSSLDMQFRRTAAKAAAGLAGAGPEIAMRRLSCQ
jgi:DNA sulfur modification protein DndC